MRKSIKRFTLAVIGMTMMFSLAACGKDDGPTKIFLLGQEYEQYGTKVYDEIPGGYKLGGTLQEGDTNNLDIIGCEVYVSEHDDLSDGIDHFYTYSANEYKLWCVPGQEPTDYPKESTATENVTTETTSSEIVTEVTTEAASTEAVTEATTEVEASTETNPEVSTDATEAPSIETSEASTEAEQSTVE